MNFKASKSFPFLFNALISLISIHLLAVIWIMLYESDSSTTYKAIALTNVVGFISYLTLTLIFIHKRESIRLDYEIEQFKNEILEFEQVKQEKPFTKRRDSENVLQLSIMFFLMSVIVSNLFIYIFA